MPTSRSLRVLGGVAAVAIVLLVVVGFASTLRKPGAPVPLALDCARSRSCHLHLHLLNFQPFFTGSGDAAYSCFVSGSAGSEQRVQVYVSHDAGVHLSLTVAEPIEHINITGCNIVVDQLNLESESR